MTERLGVNIMGHMTYRNPVMELKTELKMKRTSQLTYLESSSWS
jgi:hypothetical protein